MLKHLRRTIVGLAGLILFFLLMNNGCPVVAQDLSATRLESDRPDGASEMDRELPDYRWDPTFPIDDYEIGPNDVFHVKIWGARNQAIKTYVSNQYELLIPGVGSLSVKGKYLRDLPGLVKAKIRTRIANAEVSVSLLKARDFVVGVTGAVSASTFKSTNQFVRLNDFLSKLNGLMPNSSQLDIEIVNDRLKTSKKVSLQEFHLRGDISQNPFLRDGDRIYIPFEKNVVFIKGSVMRPGRFEFSGDNQFLKATVEKYMGGLDAGAPIQGEVSVTRLRNSKTETVTFSAEKFFSNSEPVNYSNFELNNGDQIFFPTADFKNPSMMDSVFVTGEVRVPGAQRYKAGLPLSAYISAAGGIAPRAQYEGIVVYKASGAQVDISDHPVVEPGDTIHVPEKTFKFWQDHLAILTTLLTVITTTIAISR